MRILSNRLAGMMLAVLLMLAALAQPAFAHAQLLSTNPSANQVVEAAPQQADLVFNEPVSALAVKLVQPDGASSDLLSDTVSGATMTVMLPSSLANGTYVLSWRAVSVDAHPIAGSLVFSIGAASGAAVAELPASSRVTTVLLWGAKALLFVTLFFGVGGAVFALAAPLPKAARSISTVLSAAGPLIAPLSLGLHGLDALGLSPDAIVTTAPWSAGFSTSYGTTVLAAAAAFALSLLALLLPAMRVLALLGWLLAAVALAISGHAGAAEPQWLTRPAVTLHIAGILFWVGALLPLLIWLRQDGERADRALAQFSRFIPFAVAPIVLSGITLAVIQLGPPGQAWLAPYGVILAAKLALLIVLFALALYNRLRLTEPALAGHAMARHRLRRSVAAEIIIVLVILGLVSGWRFTPPPRALTQLAAASAALSEPLYTHAMGNDAMVDITVTPGHAGPIKLEMFVTDADGAALEPLSVTVTLSAPSLGIEAFKADAVMTDGIWRVDAMTIPIAGPWLFDIELRLSRFSLSRLQTEIDIPPL